jgi:hypothetical protein
VVASFVLLGSLAACGWWEPALLLAVGAALSLGALNHRLYRFFAQTRGLWFACRSVLWHWVYFLCCGAGFAAGTCWHVFRTFGESRWPARREPCSLRMPSRMEGPQ